METIGCLCFSIKENSLEMFYFHTPILKILFRRKQPNIHSNSLHWHSYTFPFQITCVAQSGVASLIPTRCHTFAEIDHEIISMTILLPSADTRRVVVSYKRKYVHEVLVKHLVKLAKENVWLGELTFPP